MKKIYIMILATVMVLTIVSCDSSDNNTDLPSKTDGSVIEDNLTAQEQLTEPEKALFDALVKMTTEDFYDPSAVKILQIGDYNDRDTSEQGPDLVVVRLQGENRVGGTLNHYYMICITTGEATDEDSQTRIELEEELIRLLGSNTERKSRLMEKKATAGDYVELGDTYSIEKDASDVFSIGNINRALAEYWEELGF